jgi:hypothetical protein
MSINTYLKFSLHKITRIDGESEKLRKVYLLIQPIQPSRPHASVHNRGNSAEKEGCGNPLQDPICDALIAVVGLR